MLVLMTTPLPGASNAATAWLRVIGWA